MERRGLMKQPQKLDYIDGLKVLACLMIFNFHFINAFYCGIYSLNPADFHVPGVEYLLGSTPLNLIMGGKFGVRIFMTISGFFVGYRFFTTGDASSLGGGVIKKYFRLVLPIVVVNILIFAMMALGLYKNDEASILTGCQVFFGNYNQFSPNLFAALKEAFVGCFVTGENHYNGPLWFIYYEFWGTILVAAILSLLGKTKARYVAYVVGSILLIRTDFLPFILGAVVCDLTYAEPKWLAKLSGQKWLMTLLLILGFFLGSFPPIGERYEGTMYQFFPAKVLLFYIIGASMVLYALLHLEWPRKLLGNRVFVRFNKTSYGFYLLHFPIMCTFGCGLYLFLHGCVNYYLATLLVYVATFVVTTALSDLLNRFVEKPGMKLAGIISKKLSGE